MKKIMVWGSCVSRDIFNLVQDRYAVAQYIQWNPVKCFIGEALALPDEIFACAGSNWAARMLRLSCRKEVPAALREKAGEYLLIDLVDERFRLVRVRYGGKDTFLPLSQGVERLLESWKGAEETEIIPRAGISEAHYDACFDAAARLLTELYGEEKIIINEFFLLPEYVDDSLRICRYSGEEEISRTNAYLKMLYGKLEARLPKAPVIRMPSDVFGEPHHIWGLAPSHAQASFYEYALGCIDIICKESKFSALEQRYAVACRNNLLQRRILESMQERG